MVFLRKESEFGKESNSGASDKKTSVDLSVIQKKSSNLIQILNLTKGLFQIYNPSENKGLTYNQKDRETLGLLGHLPKPLLL